MKTSEAERVRNRAMRSTLTKSIKSLKELKTRAEAENHIRGVIAIIDKACQDNIIHKNKAARDKSKVMAFYNKLS